MCEDRVRRMKRDIRLTQRRARRLMRMRPSNTPVSSSDTSTSNDSSESSRGSPVPLPRLQRPIVHPKAQSTSPRYEPSSKCLIGIALQTVQLMRRNREIQMRLDELRRETTAYMTLVLQSNQTPRPNPFFNTPPETEPSEDSRSLPDLEDDNANNSDDIVKK